MIQVRWYIEKVKEKEIKKEKKELPFRILNWPFSDIQKMMVYRMSLLKNPLLRNKCLLRQK